MIKGIEFTPAMDKALQDYQNKHLITIEDIMKKAELSGSSLYKFRQRGKISINSLRKIRFNLGLDLNDLEVKSEAPEEQKTASPLSAE